MRGRDLVGFVGLTDMTLNMGNVACKYRNHEGIKLTCILEDKS